MSKYYYSYSDVAHSWIHGEDYTAHSAGERVSSHGKTISSYSTEIAQIYENKKGSKLVLFDDSRFSNTTAKHQGAIKYAIPSYIQIVNCAKVCSVNEKRMDLHKANVGYILGRIETLAKLQFKAKIRNYQHEIQDLIKELRIYVDWFKCRTSVKKHLSATDKTLYKAVIVDGNWWNNISEAINNLKVVEEKEATKKQKLNKLKIKDWLAGKYDKGAIMHLMGDTVYLRLVDVYRPRVVQTESAENGRQVGLEDNTVRVVHTSKGIELEEKEALRVYKAVVAARSCTATNERWIKFIEDNGLTTAGGWTIDRVTKDGDIIAGCHKILWSEIERFGKKYGWDKL